MSGFDLTAEDAFLEVARTYVIMARSDRLSEFDAVTELRNAGFEILPTNNEKKSPLGPSEALVRALKVYMGSSSSARFESWLREGGYMIRATAPEQEPGEAEAQGRVPGR